MAKRHIPGVTKPPAGKGPAPYPKVPHKVKAHGDEIPWRVGQVVGAASLIVGLCIKLALLLTLLYLILKYL
jgi:hypothetical protein